ncbi:unnamed protein product [Mytilus coruscus]|uniref:Prolow-density lipoprotein receptor-related protein 1-like beta-propeller domain-containing protein n=1 Tax=Mytilus coruscus TaxID=42192 RepID=A0A6J8E8J6_MYTCO|nr:unnamed protein product [Mytilus coruscus]
MKIIFQTNGLVKELDLSTGNVIILADVSSRVFAMAYDYKYGYIFLPRYELGGILRLHYTSDQSLVTVVPAAATPVNVVIDPMYDHLYWTERYTGGRIARCNFGGSNMTLITNEIQPWAIMLDLTNRWLYYSIIQPGDRSINRVRLNGSDKQTVSVLPNQILGLEMDIDQKRIYWLDFDTGKVQSARTNGSGVTEIFDSGATTSNYDFVINGDNIYCTSYNKIIKFPKYPGTTSQVIFTDISVINSILVLLTKGKYRY